MSTRKGVMPRLLGIDGYKTFYSEQMTLTIVCHIHSQLCGRRCHMPCRATWDLNFGTNKGCDREISGERWME